MSTPHHTLTGIDPNVPNVARIYDCYLGGKDHFAADREAAAKIAERAPYVAQRARENRAFLGRAVHFAASAGIRQFIDVGTGLPTQDNVHEVAWRVARDARVAYVDNDPIVLIHARAILATEPGTIAIQGDAGKPGAILRQVRRQGFIDLEQPVAVLMVAVLHFLPDDDRVTRAVAIFRENMAPGSYLIISHVTAGDLSEEEEEKLAKAVQVYSTSSAGSVNLRSREQIAALFDGLELQEPGLVPVGNWRPTGPSAFISGPTFLGGVARKPGGPQ